MLLTGVTVKMLLTAGKFLVSTVVPIPIELFLKFVNLLNKLSVIILNAVLIKKISL